MVAICAYSYFALVELIRNRPGGIVRFLFSDSFFCGTFKCMYTTTVARLLCQLIKLYSVERIVSTLISIVGYSIQSFVSTVSFDVVVITTLHFTTRMLPIIVVLFLKFI